MPTTTLPSSFILDKSATSDVSTVTPSLSNLHLATDIHNFANGGDSVQTVSTGSATGAASKSPNSDSSSSVTGLVYASESSELAGATGSFAASSDVKTLSISSSSSTKSGSSSSTSSGGSLDSTSSNGVGSIGGSMKGGRYLLLFSVFTVASMVVSL
ncbi:hypothetical protein KGF57_004231 [Candida theae]|uniref:Uncharacterized protein n=1 Tax=Candida theae TaxID=1198502 RepID=A0AAD5BBH9_9ASCO|nr:uncharacterized protein KGF57_004231 [Candida theae]KAI5950683.1 hypothetical protein KGF57_004231 [Candida theae]